MATDNDSISRSDWVLDLGSTSHMCPDRDAFSNLELFAEPTTIIQTLKAYSQGQFIYSNNMLENVLWLPVLCCNLFSVRSVNKNGDSVFPPTGETTVTWNGEEIIKGKKKGDLYIIALNCSADSWQVLKKIGISVLGM